MRELFYFNPNGFGVDFFLQPCMITAWGFPTPILSGLYKWKRLPLGSRQPGGASPPPASQPPTALTRNKKETLRFARAGKWSRTNGSRVVSRTRSCEQQNAKQCKFTSYFLSCAQGKYFSLYASPYYFSFDIINFV